MTDPTKKIHDATLRQGRNEAIATMAPGFAILARDLMAKHDGVPRCVMFEAMVRGAIEILLEEEPARFVAMELTCLAGELMQKAKKPDS